MKGADVSLLRKQQSRLIPAQPEQDAFYFLLSGLPLSPQ
jgi:hypothetical protein